MPLVPYPTELPVEAVTNVIRVVRAATFVAEKELFSSSAWNVVGYLLKVIVGELPQAAEPPVELIELKAALVEVQAAAVPAAMPIWLAILIDLLLKLLRELLPD